MFTTKKLVGGNTYVKGIDEDGVEGTQVLNSPAWEQVVQWRTQKEADVTFNTAVQDFFAPLVAAAKAREAVDESPAGTVVMLEEPTEGTSGSPEFSIELDEDGVVLRALAETDGSSLRWVNGKLVVLA